MNKFMIVARPPPPTHTHFEENAVFIPERLGGRSRIGFYKEIKATDSFDYVASL